MFPVDLPLLHDLASAQLTSFIEGKVRIPGKTITVRIHWHIGRQEEFRPRA